MRESNYSFPATNRATINTTHMLYDRRALDTTASVALLNNLCSLTFLTSTSPRIRELMTMDGGLERLLDILRDSHLPREPIAPDLWGLNGPSTARTINPDRIISLRHSLAFQCVVNIGVRGDETIRTRVVQAGALDVVAQILESWLRKTGIAVQSCSTGSQASYETLMANGQLDLRRRRSASARHQHYFPRDMAMTDAVQQNDISNQLPSDAHDSAHDSPEVAPGGINSTTTTRGLSHLVASIANVASLLQVRADRDRPQLTGGVASSRITRGGDVTGSSNDTDVDMVDGDTDDAGETDMGDTDGDNTMDVSMDELDHRDAMPEQAGPSHAAIATTPRATRVALLPLQIPPRRSPDQSTGPSSSVSVSVPGDEPTAIPRARSDNSLAMSAAVSASDPTRSVTGLSLVPRITQLAPEAVSTQSSPVGSPTRVVEHSELRGRRGTVIGRPLLLLPDQDRRNEESEASDAGTETDLAEATINAGIAAAAANQAMTAAAAVTDQVNEGAPQPAIVEDLEDAADEPNAELLEAEQARFDMEAGAPPGMRDPINTPQVTTNDNPLPGTAPDEADPAAPPPVNNTQIIVANGAPRGFQNLASYVGVSMHLNPEGTHYSEDNILLALQLLAYLSKYPHVRLAFHHPRRPIHRTFDLGVDEFNNPLPQRPPFSDTNNIVSLVERFTFRPSPTDPQMYRIPQEIQYWAGVIMRNACRKDDGHGGIRQCAYMSCGRWENFPREFAKCRRCRKAKYCSKECQSKAWSEGHRFWCNSRTDQDTDPAPSSYSGAGGDNGGRGGGEGGAGGGGADGRGARPNGGGPNPGARGGTGGNTNGLHHHHDVDMGDGTGVHGHAPTRGHMDVPHNTTRMRAALNRYFERAGVNTDAERQRILAHITARAERATINTVPRGNDDPSTFPNLLGPLS